MTIPSLSDPAQYRVTFFFGPEADEHRPDHLRCVFNVKKRSWKGGVQVAVDVTHDHLDRTRKRISYDSWLQELLRRVGQEGHTDVAGRADDLFVQAFCTCTLNLAIQAGLEQENQVIAAKAFEADLDQLLNGQPEQVTDRIRLELDLGELSDV